jgi:hypothetical protein
MFSLKNIASNPLKILFLEIPLNRPHENLIQVGIGSRKPNRKKETSDIIHPYSFAYIVGRFIEY